MKSTAISEQALGDIVQILTVIARGCMMMKVETSGRMCDAVDGGTGGRLTAANVRDVDWDGYTTFDWGYKRQIVYSS